MELNAFKLCYVDNGVAYFTTKELAKQWGDDWNDAPYEHNAGTPYEPSVHYYADGSTKLSPDSWNTDGTPKWQLLELRFSAQGNEFLEPCSEHHNSPFSVESINEGQVPWLKAQVWSRQEKEYSIAGELKAGATVDEFISFIEKFDGVVWVPRQGIESRVYPQPKTEFEMAAKS